MRKMLLKLWPFCLAAAMGLLLLLADAGARRFFLFDHRYRLGILLAGFLAGVYPSLARWRRPCLAPIPLLCAGICWIGISAVGSMNIESWQGSFLASLPYAYSTQTNYLLLGLLLARGLTSARRYSWADWLLLALTLLLPLLLCLLQAQTGPILSKRYWPSSQPIGFTLPQSARLILFFRVFTPDALCVAAGALSRAGQQDKARRPLLWLLPFAVPSLLWLTAKLVAAVCEGWELPQPSLAVYSNVFILHPSLGYWIYGVAGALAATKKAASA